MDLNIARKFEDLIAACTVKTFNRSISQKHMKKILAYFRMSMRFDKPTGVFLVPTTKLGVSRDVFRTAATYLLETMKLGTYIYVLSVPDIVVCLRFIFYFNHFVCMYAPFLISVHKCTIVWGAGVLLASMWLMYIHYMKLICLKVLRQKEDGRNRKQACGQQV